jgi:hypothetical protein
MNAGFREVCLKINIMKHKFQIRPLAQNEFQEITKLTEAELQKIGALRMVVDKLGKFPCRVSLEDAEVGEEVILLTYNHHKTTTPYRASGPVFIRQILKEAEFGLNEIPSFLNHRYLSLRSYSKEGMMKEAFTSEGKDLQTTLEKAFDNSEASYVHIHNARHGCYLCAAERV